MFFDGRLSQCGFKNRVAISPQIFGVVERKIRHLQKITGIHAVLWRQRDADTGADADDFVVDGKRFRNKPDNASGKRFGGVTMAEIVDLDDGEFIAPEPRQNVGFPQRPFKSLGHLPEQFVAGGMTECVIDLLELIEVDHEDIEFLFPPTITSAGVFDFFHQGRAIGQPSEGIVVGQKRNASLVAPPLGNVLVHREPAAIDHGMAQYQDDAAITQLLNMGRITQLSRDVFGGGGPNIIAAAGTKFQNFTKRRSGLDQFLGQIVDLPIAFVGDQEFL